MQIIVSTISPIICDWLCDCFAFNDNRHTIHLIQNILFHYHDREKWEGKIPPNTDWASRLAIKIFKDYLIDDCYNQEREKDCTTPNTANPNFA
ncbi:MAG: hypothetical protein ACLRZ6_14875 [Lachnospiraceae bacterium]